MQHLCGITCLWFVHSLGSAQATTCLTGAIFPTDAQRQIFAANEQRMISVLVDDVQKLMPIGILSYNWASAEFVAAVFKLLSSEVLGFNTTITGRVGSTMTALWGVGGCTSMGNFAQGYTAAGCGAEITENHFAFEAWGGGNLIKMEFMKKELKELAPEMLGHLGYVGTESMYVLESNYQTAWNTRGAALEFYKTYNADWNTPSDSFNGTTAIDRSQLKTCSSELTVYQDGDMRAYEKYTGDTAGVEEVAGSMRAVCDGPWWYSPACRNDTSKCVPIITAGNGYAVESFMQASTANNMPVALATASTWGLWETISKETGTLFYWWTPDTTFVEMKPVEVIFPAYDGLAWAQGDKRSGPSGADLSKWVNKRLRAIVPDVVDLVERMQFSSLGDHGINAALFYKKSQGASADWGDVACWWAQNYYKVWKNWIRDPTECSPGQGIVNAGGTYLTSRNTSHPGGGTATSCTFCSSGFKSEELKDTDSSYIYVCSACGTGTYQEGAGATFCFDCPLGSFINEEEATACERCGKGYFADELGAQSCGECENSMTTEGAGSISQSECVCPVDTYRQISDGSCGECPEGMFCEEGSDEAYLPSESQSGASRRLSGTFPVAAQNYMTMLDEPLAPYRCTVVMACPGGPPGTCAEMRTGLACAMCADSNKPTKDGICGKCDGPETLAVVLFWLVLAFAAIFIYLATNGATPACPTPRLCLQSCTSLLLTSVQIYGVISLLRVNYPDNIKTAFQAVQWSMLDLDDTLWIMWCTYNHSPQFKYFSTVAVFPYIILVLGLLTIFGKFVPTKFPITPRKAANSAGAFLMGAFISMTSVAMTPMVCYGHPNGKRSVVAYSQVLCWQGEHWGLFVVGLLLLLAALGFFAVVVFVVLQAPALQKKSGVREFFTTFRFLINMYRTDKWWWSLVMIPRGLLLTLIRAVFPDSPNIQVLVMIVLLVVYAILLGTTRPWKVPLMNLLDSIISALIIVCLSSASAFMPEPMNPSTIYTLTLVVGTLGLIIMLGAWLTAGIFVFLEFKAGRTQPLGEETSEGVAPIFLMRKHAYDVLSGRVLQCTKEVSQFSAEDLAAAMKRWQIYDVQLMVDMIQALNSYSIIQHESVTSLPPTRLRNPDSQLKAQDKEAAKPEAKPAGGNDNQMEEWI